jgi:hypothetical protein
MAIYSGKTGNVTALAGNTIVSSTDATPIVLQLTTPVTSAIDGTRGSVTGHATNVAANGIWQVQFVDVNHVALIGSVGSGAGAGAGGKFNAYTLGATTIVDDSAIPNAGQFNVPPEFDLDVSAFISETGGKFKIIDTTTFRVSVGNTANTEVFWDEFVLPIASAPAMTDLTVPGTTWQVTFPTQTSDVVDFAVETSYTFQTSGSVAGFGGIDVSIWVSDVAVGAADNYAYLGGSSRVCQFEQISAGSHTAMGIGSYKSFGRCVVINAGNKLKFKLRATMTGGGPPNQTGGHVRLVSDYIASAIGYRLTTMPQ